MSFDLGAVVPLGTTVRDASGVLVSSGNMALIITLPDQTTTMVATVEPETVGTYRYDYQTVQPGRHVVRWLGTGVNPAAYTDNFDVREAAPPAILSLADAKAHLNIVSSAHDDELRGWVEAVTAAVETFTGPVVIRTVVEEHNTCGQTTLALRQTPVLSLTSLTSVLSGGTSYAVDGLDVSSWGTVRSLTGSPFHGVLRATYVAGRQVVPAAISSAAKIILQHLWKTQQGPGRPQRGLDDFDVTEPMPGLGYAIPNRAVQLLEPYKQPPGVA
jgi:hypothetical protein